MFGVAGSGDTSGFGGLVRRRTSVLDSPRPYGGYYDEIVDALHEELSELPGTDGATLDISDAIEKVVLDRGELTLHIAPQRIKDVCQVMRDSESLRFELCSSVSGVDYLGTDDRRL